MSCWTYGTVKTVRWRREPIISSMSDADLMRHGVVVITTAQLYLTKS